jgi:glycosyltransferase involved in cell wall biosynthesis
MARVALDGMAVRRAGRGVSRVLRELLPRLVSGDSALDCFILTTREGRSLLGKVGGEVTVVPSMPKSIWEQSGLPFFAARGGAQVIYSHSESAPLWGPGVVLHVPEDPYLRWEGAAATSWREHARRAYQRLTMERGLRRSLVLVVSCEAVAAELGERFGGDLPRTVIVPLGVDTDVFFPEPDDGTAPFVFHLGSSEPRDETAMVLGAYRRALRLAPDLPDLKIGGDLGGLAERLLAQAAELGIERRVHLLGRISDEELRRCYSHAALCVQPAHYEGFGLQPLEALACGAPLVVFKEPAVEEVVGTSAWVVPGRTEEALSEAIALLWRDATQRARLRLSGPKRAAQFPWSASAEMLARVLAELSR